MHYKPPTFNELFPEPRMRKKHAFNALVCYLGTWYHMCRRRYLRCHILDLCSWNAFVLRFTTPLGWNYQTCRQVRIVQCLLCLVQWWIFTPYYLKYRYCWTKCCYYFPIIGSLVCGTRGSKATCMYRYQTRVLKDCRYAWVLRCRARRRRWRRGVLNGARRWMERKCEHIVWKQCFETMILWSLPWWGGYNWSLKYTV